LESWAEASVKTQTNLPERFRKPAGFGLPDRLKVKYFKKDDN